MRLYHLRQLLKACIEFLLGERRVGGPLLALGRPNLLLGQR